MWSSGSSLFPSFCPPFPDQMWLSVDRPSDDEAELTKREQAHQNWLDKLGEQGQDIPPIGKSASAEQFNAEEEEEEEDEEEGEESESQDDDEIDDLMEDHESPDDDNEMEASRGGNQANVAAGNNNNNNNNAGAPRGTDTPPWAL